MQRQIHIVGTGHHYQFGAEASFGACKCTHADADAFVGMLRQLIKQSSIDVLVEELNQQALQEIACSRPVVQSLAAELALPHLFCDPNRAERVSLGIQDENEIRARASFKSLPEQEVERRVAKSRDLREEEWWKRITFLDSSRVLLVCGANHVSTVSARAAHHGFQATVAHEDWKPS